MDNPPELRTCPQCQKQLPITSFNGLPLDERCHHCVPQDTAMELYDKRVQLAGQTVAQLLDQAGHQESLPALESAVSGLYAAWGGPHVLFKDFYDWTQELAARGKHNAALTALVNILKLHAKVDRNKLEDDWQKMDEDQVRVALEQRMVKLLSEIAGDKAKMAAMQSLLENTREA